MARLKGPILFTGSLGNIRSYYDKRLKRYILSTKGGASGELIKNSPVFARTRENMNEFKACGQWSSQLRKSLLSLAHLHDSNYFSAIVSLAKSIQKHDDQRLKGYRAVESSKASRQLTQLNFNSLHPFDHVMSHPFEIQFSEDKSTVSFNLTGFKSYSRLNWPTRFQSYRIALVIAQLPDWIWNEEDESYGPVMMDLEQLTVSAFSEWRPCSDDPVDVALSASFAQPALQHPNTTVIVAIGLEVSSYPTNQASFNPSGFGTMKIAACYV